MPLIRATARLAQTSGLAEDQVVNVWHFLNDEGVLTTPHAAAIGLQLGAFYANNALAAFWSQSIGRVGLIHAIDISTVSIGLQGPEDDQVSELFASYSFAITQAPVAASIPLPSEVASCLSFRGDNLGLPEESGATRPAARKRGRVFLGPFNSGICEADGAGRAFVDSAWVTAVNTSYQAMVASLNTRTPKMTHVVYSPTLGETSTVEEVSVDDAFDTIRSRGQKATTRTKFVVNQTD